MKSILVFIKTTTFLFITLNISAQTVGDAVRYSNFNSSGTARTAGVGNSFGAMGGDFGVLSINPAGLADFRKGEMMFSLSMNTANSDAFLQADASRSTNDNIAGRLFLDNIGIVFSKNVGRKLKTSNFAIGLNQLANYTESIRYIGSVPGSITERFVQRANGLAEESGFRVDGDLFESDLAFNVGAIYEDPDSDLFYLSDYSGFTNALEKGQTISRAGRVNELSFTWAGNFKNAFGLGIGIGIPFISFEEDKSYFENDSGSEIQYFERLEFNETLATSGVGINLKIGANATIARVLRLGLALHTPTAYSLTDDFNTSISYRADTNGEFDLCNSPQSNGTVQICEDEPAQPGRFEYSIVTPAKIVLSAGGLFNFNPDLKGFINADVEYKDYTANNFDLGDDSGEIAFTNELNGEVDDQLQSAINIKLGGELAFKKYRFRAGANLIGSPYADETFNSVSNLYSAGLGYRGNKFYIDAAFQTNTSRSGFTPYRVLDEENNPNVSSETNRNKFLFTFGFKF